MADTDGNEATEHDADWTPLVQNPPYPEYSSGHDCVTGATSNTFGYLFGADAIDLNVSPSVTGTSRPDDSADALDEETVNARIWLGIHFRRAMTDGNQLGHDVSNGGITHYLQPTDRVSGSTAGARRPTSRRSGRRRRGGWRARCG